MNSLIRVLFILALFILTSCNFSEELNKDNEDASSGSENSVTYTGSIPISVVTDIAGSAKIKSESTGITYDLITNCIDSETDNETYCGNIKIYFFEDDDHVIIRATDTTEEYADVAIIATKAELSENFRSRVSSDQNISINIDMYVKNPSTIGFINNSYTLNNLFFTPTQRSGDNFEKGCYTPEEIGDYLNSRYHSGMEDVSSFMCIVGDNASQADKFIQFGSSYADNVNKIQTALNNRLSHVYGTTAAVLENEYMELTCYIPQQNGVIGSFCEIKRGNDVCVIENNRPPTISGIPTISSTAESLYSFTPTASDPNNDTLVFSINKDMAIDIPWATFDTATGIISGTPENADAGLYSDIIISVSDGAFTTSLTAFDLTINVNNTPPSISGFVIPVIAVDARGTTKYNFVGVTSDIDGDVVSVTFTHNKPDWATINDPVTGSFSGDLGIGDVGEYTDITLTATDGNGGSVDYTFDINIIEPVVQRTGITIRTNTDDDGDFEAGREIDFTNSGTIVVDNNRNLMWQNLADVDLPRGLSRDAAFTYCNDTASTGGHTDWRLPTAEELLSISDYSLSPSLVNEFEVIANTIFWTSDNITDDATRVYGIATIYGRLTIESIDLASFAARCVRDISSSSVIVDRFVRDNSTDIVVDKKTGLIWYDNEVDKNTIYTVSHSILTCKGLTFGGYSDWRLTNVNEMLSIANYEEKPFFDDAVFKSILHTSSGGKRYWTSSRNGNVGGVRHYYVSFGKLRADFGTSSGATNRYYFRCVRGANSK